MERLVADYAALPWDSEAIARTQRELPRLRGTQREVIAIRLANELEDHLDLGMHYCGEGLYHELYRGPALEGIFEIARGLRLPRLAKALDQTVRASNAAVRPAVLRRSQRFGELIPPARSQSST